MTNYTMRSDFLVRAIAEGSFPRYLYKYRVPSDRTKSIFESNSIWFSSPKDFNDPFDCNLSEVEEHSQNDVKNFYKHIMEGRVDGVYWMEQKPNAEKLKEIMERAKNQVLLESGVLCLSKKFDDILMWSHYTDSHKGLVIEFDLQADPDFFISPVNVNYVDDYEPTNYFADPHTSVTRLISTKSSCWKYEEEVRIIKQNGAGLRNFLPQSISGVFFGCQTDESFAEQIKKLCGREELKHIKFSSMKTMRSKFALEREETRT